MEISIIEAIKNIHEKILQNSLSTGNEEVYMHSDIFDVLNDRGDIDYLHDIGIQVNSCDDIMVLDNGDGQYQSDVYVIDPETYRENLERLVNSISQKEFEAKVK